MQEFYYKQAENGTYAVVEYHGDEQAVTVPQDGVIVSILGDKLFAGHPEITSVTLPDSITDLGEFLFDGCDRLAQLTLPPGLRFLWGHTFARCGLEQIVLPDSLVSIPPFAFKDCKKLKRVVCGAGMKQIHAWAFSGCDALKEVVCGPRSRSAPGPLTKGPEPDSPNPKHTEERYGTTDCKRPDFPRAKIPARDRG